MAVSAIEGGLKKQPVFFSHLTLLALTSKNSMTRFGLPVSSRETTMTCTSEKIVMGKNFPVIMTKGVTSNRYKSRYRLGITRAPHVVW